MLRFFSSRMADSMCRRIRILADARVPSSILDPAIKVYSVGMGVDMDEAEIPSNGFHTFGEFFARHLKDGVRPYCQEKKALMSPADGRIVAISTIQKGPKPQFEVKGTAYSIDHLLGESTGDRFAGGSGLVIYLHPRDYHRVHVPQNGELIGTRHIPGTRYPVAPWSESRVSGLYGKNERVVFSFQVEGGYLTLVMVAAFGVGNIESQFSPPTQNRYITSRSFDESISLDRGEELGAFRLGSTVVLLWSENAIDLDDTVGNGRVLLGQKLGVASRRAKKRGETK